MGKSAITLKRNQMKKEDKNLPERRDLNEQELREYLKLVEICNTERWKAVQFASNTALIPDGQKVAATQEAIANLLENSRNNWISHVLKGCGVPSGQSVNVHSETGKIEYAKASKEDKEAKEEATKEIENIKKRVKGKIDKSKK